MFEGKTCSLGRSFTIWRYLLTGAEATRADSFPLLMVGSAPHEASIYRMLVKETRCGAVCPQTYVLVLMIGGKCSPLEAKAAHLSGHLPETFDALPSVQTS